MTSRAGQACWPHGDRAEFAARRAASGRDYVHVGQAGVGTTPRGTHGRPRPRLTESSARLGPEPPTTSSDGATGRPWGSASTPPTSYDNHQLAWVEVAVHPSTADRLRHRAARRDDRAARSRAALSRRRWLGLRCRARIRRRPRLREGGRDDPTPAPGRVMSPRSTGAPPRRCRTPRRTNWSGGRPDPGGGSRLYARMAAAINDAPTDDLESRTRPIRRSGSGPTRRPAGARHPCSGSSPGTARRVSSPVRPPSPSRASDPGWPSSTTRRGPRAPWPPSRDAAEAGDGALAGERQPPVTTIDTWNSDSNDHMIEVNEALGYEVSRGRCCSSDRSSDRPSGPDRGAWPARGC